MLVHEKHVRNTNIMSKNNYIILYSCIRHPDRVYQLHLGQSYHYSAVGIFMLGFVGYLNLNLFSLSNLESPKAKFYDGQHSTFSKTESLALLASISGSRNGRYGW